jgi:ketosteroid isomerase-like protein
VLALGACAGVPSPSATSFDEQSRKSVIEVLESQKESWNRGDLTGYMEGYERSEALVFTSGAKVRRGWQETHDKYQAKYGSDASGMGHLEFEILDVRGLGGRGAVVLGRWSLTETPNSGSGVFTVVLERTGAGWKVVHDHTSAGG